jgi:phage-related minor tail protein
LCLPTAAGLSLLLQDIQLRDLNRTRAALNEAKEECARLRQQIVLAHQ